MLFLIYGNEGSKRKKPAQSHLSIKRDPSLFGLL